MEKYRVINQKHKFHPQPDQKTVCPKTLELRGNHSAGSKRQWTQRYVSLKADTAYLAIAYVDIEESLRQHWPSDWDSVRSSRQGETTPG